MSEWEVDNMFGCAKFRKTGIYFKRQVKTTKLLQPLRRGRRTYCHELVFERLHTDLGHFAGCVISTGHPAGCMPCMNFAI